MFLPHIHTQKKQKAFDGNGYFYLLNCDDGFMGVHIYPNSLNYIIYVKYVQFMYVIMIQYSCFLKNKKTAEIKT